jgi:hypothetical protein
MEEAKEAKINSAYGEKSLKLKHSKEPPHNPD